MTAADYLASMLADPWLMGGLGIGVFILGVVVWAFRVDRRTPDRYDSCHIVVMGVDDDGRAWYVPHCGRCAVDGPMFPATYTDEAWDAIYEWDHRCERVSS